VLIGDVLKSDGRENHVMKRLLGVDWDVIAGILAAVSALLLHLFHIVDVEVLFAITLVILALLLLRDLRAEHRIDLLAETAEQTKAALDDLRSGLQRPDTVLIGPQNLRSESRRFTQSAHGDMVWFNVCFLMFRRQEVFDDLLRPAIENQVVTSVQFVSNESEKELWPTELLPKIKACAGSEKVREPIWRKLPESVSFILADVEQPGATEALLSFWGEPFMARSTERSVPRYVFRVLAHSQLLPRLIELDRQHRMGD
jgi:hypothetical protein